jgi:hypothetical protein
VVILNTSGPFLTFYPAVVYEQHLGRPILTRTLSSLNGRMTLERTGDRSFILRTDRPGWLSSIFSRLVRLEPRLTEGQTRQNALFQATLLQLTPDGRDVLVVRFDFKVPLSDPSLLFLTWDGERFVPMDVASLELGRPRALADTSDIWKSMN